MIGAINKNSLSGSFVPLTDSVNRINKRKAHRAKSIDHQDKNAKVKDSFLNDDMKITR